MACISCSNVSFNILDQDVLKALEPYQVDVEKLIKTVVGTIETTLERSRTQESSFGNFVTDAFVQYVSTIKS
jgi:2',3'-cyclic-nucleotide 2'-phosphodiesterase (5'-nucleotidase family)